MTTAQLGAGVVGNKSMSHKSVTYKYARNTLVKFLSRLDKGS